MLSTAGATSMYWVLLRDEIIWVSSEGLLSPGTRVELRTRFVVSPRAEMLLSSSDDTGTQSTSSTGAMTYMNRNDQSI